MIYWVYILFRFYLSSSELAIKKMLIIFYNGLLCSTSSTLPSVPPPPECTPFSLTNLWKPGGGLRGVVEALCTTLVKKSCDDMQNFISTFI